MKRVLAVLLLIPLFLLWSCKKEEPVGNVTPPVVVNSNQSLLPENPLLEIGETSPVEDEAEEISETVSGALIIDSLSMPQDLIERFSYSYGFLIMDASMRDIRDIDSQYFIRGMLDYALNRPSFFSREQMNGVLFEYQDKLIADAASRLAELAQRNLAEAEQFLAVNEAKPSVLTTSSGLQYEVVKATDGLKPKEGDVVKINYLLSYLDGRVGDSSVPGIPSTFALSDLISGFREGLMLMSLGSTYRFYLHPSLGYGVAGSPNIETNMLLIFDVELVDIVRR